MVDLAVYPCGVNTSDELTKSLPIVNLGNLIDWDMSLISDEERKKEIRRKYLHLNATLCNPQQFRGRRIWTLTRDTGRARSGVGEL